MLHYSRLQLTTIIAVPIVTIVLLWAIVIFHRNRKKWRCYDLTIVAILVQSVLRNVAIIIYTVLQMANQNDIKFDYCSIFVWLFNSIHSFQASTLSTLAVIGFFSMKLHRKKDNLKNYLTSAHVVYHLFCLTTLCACVGVAAILAKQSPNEFTTNFNFFPLNLCKFMPYEMDVKYNVFVITLHVFLAVISLVSFLLLCYQFYLARRAGFDYLKKSNSDLSELSLGLTSSNYYDTYTVSKMEDVGVRNKQFQNRVREQAWHSDHSNMSTTVSSTNSRRPCLNKQEKDPEEEIDGIGLETILPVLTVCYLFNHLPIIILCLFPWVLSPWSVATAALCLGLLQDLLVPLSLGLVDSRFCQWISNVYRCDNRSKLNDKLPQVGLDGKFRPFPVQQTLNISQVPPDSHRIYQQSSEPKFPITNGSLYTSIDGRLPIIHNYRRHKERGIKPAENNLINLGVHATYLKQHEQITCATYENTSTKFPSGTKINTPAGQENSERFGSLFFGRQFQTSFGGGKNSTKKSLSQNSLRDYNNEALPGNNLRLSKSHDSLDKIVKDPGRFEQKLAFSDPTNTDSEDEYFTDSMNLEGGKNFDSISSNSSFSITTEANCDFDFYQLQQDEQNNNTNNNNNIDFVAMHSHQTPEFLKFNSDDQFMNYTPRILQTFKPHLVHDKPEERTVNHREIRVTKVSDLKRNFKIKRSNSKRSLENFVNFINDNEFAHLNTMQRSFSYLALDETNNNLPGMSRARQQSMMNMNRCQNVQTVKNCGGSVPDFKKIFISEYL